MKRAVYNCSGIILIFSLCLIPAAVSCTNLSCSSKGANRMEELRKQMVKNQIEARGVTSPSVLEALSKVERHLFVPKAHLDDAYADHPLPIGKGQTISQPYIVALMSELCELKGNEKVLEIGTGSGYQAAVLSHLAKSVYSIEIVPSLGKAAIKRLKNLGYNNVTVQIGDGYKGWPEEAPFDVIILTASPPEIPQALLNQLKEGGVLAAPEGDSVLPLLTANKENRKKTITYVRFVPMVHKEKTN